jgi:hypothetical protein
MSWGDYPALLELQAYIARARNRTTNTIEEWNLMLTAERELNRHHSDNCGFHLHMNPEECTCHKATEIIPPPDHNGGWEPPLG